MKKIFIVFRKSLLFLCAVFMAASTVAQAAECNVEYCSSCSSDETYCFTCENGWDQYRGKCYELLPHCTRQKYSTSSLDSQGRSCSSCEEGYIPYEFASRWGNCEKREPWMEHCTNLGTRNFCQWCEVGYGALMGSEHHHCIPCEDENATDCSQSDVSSECKPGYVAAQGYHTVRWCYKEILNCKRYNGDEEADSPCRECESGYTLSADGKSCEKKPVCPENAVCSDGNVTCNSGYELKDGACVKPACPANCSACSSSTACTACDSGYSLIGGKCVAGTVAKCPPDSSISPDGCCCVPN